MKLPFVSRSAAEQTESRLTDLQAEYSNYRRRNADIQDTSYNRGCSDAAAALLPVYDNLLRALEQPCADEAFLTGIRMTRTSMESALKSLGIEIIPAEGQPFDPMLHEAVDHIEDDSLEEGIVTKVILTGFKKGDTVIRHALVIVAN